MGQNLRLYLCEPFRVVANGIEVVRLRTRKTESILAFLALRRGIWITREELVGIFWPDESLVDSKPKLRLALHSIRGVLGSRLESMGDSLCVSEIWVDALDEEPVELVGCQILPGRFEDWALPFQMVLERRVESACVRVYRQAETSEDKIAGLLDLLRVEPLNVDYHVALFQALTAANNRAAATAAARHAARLLGRDCPEALREAAKGPDPRTAAGLTVAQLAHALLGQDEPVIVTLLGPAGIGKTYTAKQLSRLAKEEDVEVQFLSLAEWRGDLAIEHALVEGKGDLADLPPTLIVLDNAEDLADAQFGFLNSQAFRMSSLRVLITSQRPVTEAGEVVRMPAKTLPASSDRGDLAVSETAQFIAREMELEVDEIDRTALFQACRTSGGLPLAIKLIARDLQRGELDEKGVAGSLSIRLNKSYGRLDTESRTALDRLLPLRPAFHTNFAELVNVDKEMIRSLHERSWIEPTGEIGVFEILPPIRRFLEEHTGVDDIVLSDLGRAAVSRSSELLASNYVSLIREFLPSVGTVESLIGQLMAGGRQPEAAQLYASLYFCYQRLRNVERPVEIGLGVFGIEEGPFWETSWDGLNAFASACFFAKKHDLAERMYRRLSQSDDPRFASIGLTNLGLIALNRGESAEAVSLIEASLEGGELKPRQRAARMNNLSKAYAIGGQFEQAKEIAEAAVRQCGEEEELSIMKAVLYFSLAEIHLMAGDRESGTAWVDRSLRAFSGGGEKLRLLEGGFLKAYLASSDVKEAKAIAERTLPRLEFAAPHWAMSAACLLCAFGRKAEAAELASGLDVKSQPNWVQFVLSKEIATGGIGIPLTNSERYALFREAMKRV